MAHQETRLDTQILYQGRIIEVRKDRVKLENEKETVRELVVHHGGVCIAAVDEQDRLLLVRQFRYPYGKEIIELPAGKIEQGEDPQECEFGSFRRSADVPQTGLKSLESCIPLRLTAPRSSISIRHPVCMRPARSWMKANFWMCCEFLLNRRFRWCWTEKFWMQRPKSASSSCTLCGYSRRCKMPSISGWLHEN